MHIHRSRGSKQSSVPLALTAILAGCACGAGEVGGPGSEGSTGEWQPDHNFTPDDTPCAAPECDSGDLSACCAGVQPAADDTADGGIAIAGDCPSSVYPNNWTCVSGQCIHGGCSTDADCGDPMLDCLDPADVTGTTKFCIETFSTSPDSCDFVNTGMKCTGSTGQVGYCRQDPFPE